MMKNINYNLFGVVWPRFHIIIFFISSLSFYDHNHTPPRHIVQNSCHPHPIHPILWYTNQSSITPKKTRSLFTDLPPPRFVVRCTHPRGESVTRFPRLLTPHPFASPGNLVPVLLSSKFRQPYPSFPSWRSQSFPSFWVLPESPESASSIVLRWVDSPAALFLGLHFVVVRIAISMRMYFYINYM